MQNYQSGHFLHNVHSLRSDCHARHLVCRFGDSIAAVRMALSVEDIIGAQIEVLAYQRLQQLQGKHVPQLLGYGQCGQGFYVATSYIKVRCTSDLPCMGSNPMGTMLLKSSQCHGAQKSLYTPPCCFHMVVMYSVTCTKSNRTREPRSNAFA